MMVEETVRRRKSGDLRVKIKAAKDLRKSSSSNSKSALRDRFATADAIEPLVSILHGSLPLAALLALLNLAARNQSEVLCFGEDLHRVCTELYPSFWRGFAPEFWRGFAQGCVCHFVDYSALTTSQLSPIIEEVVVRISSLLIQAEFKRLSILFSIMVDGSGENSFSAEEWISCAQELVPRALGNEGKNALCKEQLQAMSKTGVLGEVSFPSAATSSCAEPEVAVHGNLKEFHTRLQIWRRSTRCSTA
ncbi:hypothetical protein SASPL_117775 [Salvia splendens]|uniref:Uncharacterized protein n=1 Tax=Salvia splendens TaxID=180675 RepID=A0A8X8XWF1_SALSN|nr:hypothetical protein SASPL_117775 [Salvia splendens]